MTSTCLLFNTKSSLWKTELINPTEFRNLCVETVNRRNVSIYTRSPFPDDGAERIKHMWHEIRHATSGTSNPQFICKIWYNLVLCRIRFVTAAKLIRCSNARVLQLSCSGVSWVSGCTNTGAFDRAHSWSRQCRIAQTVLTPNSSARATPRFQRLHPLHDWLPSLKVWMSRAEVIRAIERHDSGLCRWNFEITVESDWKSSEKTKISWVEVADLCITQTADTYLWNDTTGCWP